MMGGFSKIGRAQKALVDVRDVAKAHLNALLVS